MVVACCQKSTKVRHATSTPSADAVASRHILLRPSSTLFLSFLPNHAVGAGRGFSSDIRVAKRCLGGLDKEDENKWLGSDRATHRRRHSHSTARRRTDDALGKPSSASTGTTAHGRGETGGPGGSLSNHADSRGGLPAREQLQCASFSLPPFRKKSWEGARGGPA